MAKIAKIAKMTKAEYLQPVFDTFSAFHALRIESGYRVKSLTLDSCKRLYEIDALERKYQTPRGEHVRLLETWINQLLENEGK
jgi:hypothetical protein